MVRQGLNVIRNLSHLSSEFLHAGLDFRRILLQLFEFERQHCEPLVDVVMKLSSNASAFFLLSFNHLSGHVRQRLFRQFALRDIYVDADHARGLTRLVHKTLPAPGYPMKTPVRQDHPPFTLSWL